MSEMKTRLTLCGLLVAAAAGTSQVSAGVDYEVGLSMGRLHDTNVSIDRLDVNANEGDSGTETRFKAGLKKKLGKAVTLKAKYSLMDKQYDEFDDFDLQTHIGSMDLAYSTSDRGKLGVSVHAIEGRLGGKSYLSMTRVAPYYGEMIGKRYYLRGEIAEVEKTFDVASGRDAETTSGSLSLYHFLDGGRHYISAGYSYSDEDALDDAYDYHAHEIKASWSKKLALSEGDELVMKAGGKVEERDYGSDSETNGKVRSDLRSGVYVGVEYHMGKGLYLDLTHEYMDIGSNVDSRDYHQEVTTLTLGWEL